MTELQVTARLKIHDGKLEDFEKIAATCLRSVQEKDSGTLQYDWFFNEDRTECIVHEKYKSSEALLEHIGHLGDTLGALLSVSDFSVDVFGDPSPELLQAVADTDLTVYRYF